MNQIQPIPAGNWIERSKGPLDNDQDRHALLGEILGAPKDAKGELRSLMLAKACLPAARKAAMDRWVVLTGIGTIETRKVLKQIKGNEKEPEDIRAAAAHWLRASPARMSNEVILTAGNVDEEEDVAESEVVLTAGNMDEEEDVAGSEVVLTAGSLDMEEEEDVTSESMVVLTAGSFKKEERNGSSLSPRLSWLDSLPD